MTPDFDLYESALGSLYEAPTHPGAWLDFMGRFGRLINACGGQYHLWDPAQNQMGFSVITEQYPESDTAYYNTHLAPIDPRRRLTEQAPAGQWFYDYEHFDARFVDRSDVFRWLQSFDIRYSAGVRLTEEGGMLAVMGLFRAPGQSAFDTEARRWLDRVTPHIQRASMLHLRLESLRASAGAGWQAANLLDYPILIVDERACLRFANLAAENLLRLPGAPVQVRQGALGSPTPSVQEKLGAAVRMATRRAGRRGTVLALQRSPGAPVYQLVVLPTREDCEFTFGSDRPLALITLGAPGQGRSVEAELLRQLFGLSDAEARVVAAIAQGSTLKDVAEESGVSINTVRTQLHSAFGKTDTHRQAELVALVDALPRVRR
jgi:DNA-binding CsgD family transcriptional regulator